MEIFKYVVSWLVAFSGFFIPLLFYPQIRLLYKEKLSNSLSLGMIWGSFLIQACVAIDAFFNENYKLMFLQLVSLVCLTIIISQAHYYRAFPGGR
jgi:uncharacterized protein with PQ loop repeat